MKDVLRKIVTWLLPLSIRRKLFHPMIVPTDYRDEIELAETVLSWRVSKTNLDDAFWSAELRKFAHILDKGLQRCDCEPGHSNDFFKQAKDCLMEIKSPEYLNEDSINWAKEIISSYEKFQAEEKQAGGCEEFQLANCNFAQIDSLIKTRRSIRDFQDKPIQRADLRKIAQSMKWAPSSCNRQTSKIFIVDDPKLIESCIENNNGATCFSHNPPCFMSFCADLRPYLMPQEMILPILDTALGIQNCALVAHSLGIGMTILNWTHHSKQQDLVLRKLLKIPSHYRIIANALLGWPGHGAPTPVRKSDFSAYTFVEGE